MAVNFAKFMNGAGSIHERFMNKKNAAAVHDFCHERLRFLIFRISDPNFHEQVPYPRSGAWERHTLKNPGHSTSNIQWTSEHPRESANLYMLPALSPFKLSSSSSFRFDFACSPFLVHPAESFLEQFMNGL